MKPIALLFETNPFAVQTKKKVVNKYVCKELIEK